MEFQKVVVISVTVLFWVSSVYGMYRSWRGKKGTAAIQTWMFGVLICFATLLRISNVYIAFNRFFGIRNLAWFLSYLSGAVAIYFLVNALKIVNQSSGTGLRRLLIITLLALTAIFIPVAQGPELVDHTNPQTFPAILYMLVFYTFLMIGCLAALQIYRHLWRNEAVLATRLRWLTATFCLFGGTLFFGGRITYLLVLLIAPTAVQLPAMSALGTANDLLFLISAGGWALFFMPANVTRSLAWLIIIVNNVFTLQNLNMVKQEVLQLYKPVVDLKGNWWAHLRNLDLYLHQALVVIWDGKSMMASDIGEVIPARLAQVTPKRTATWDMSKLKKLHNSLSDVDDEADYQEVVAAYNRIGRAYRSQKIALWISRIVHPFVIAMVTVIVAVSLSGNTFVEAISWASISFAITIAPLLAFIIFNVRRNRYSDMDISIREQRHSMFAVAIVSAAILLLFLNGTQAPWAVQFFFYAGLFYTIVGAVINFSLTKISFHSAVAAGCATVMLVISWPISLIFYVAALCVGWSRVRLGSHTLNQVILGWGVAFISTLLVYNIYS